MTLQQRYLSTVPPSPGLRQILERNGVPVPKTSLEAVELARGVIGLPKFNEENNNVQT